MTPAQDLFYRRRGEYTEGKMSFYDYYFWLGEFIGVTDSAVPFTIEQLKKSYDKDPTFNGEDTPLIVWDGMNPLIMMYAHARGLPWSLSDTVCVLKVRAQHMMKRM